MTLMIFRFRRKPKKTEFQLKMESAMAGFSALNEPMLKLAQSADQAAKSIAAFYKPLYEAKPRNWRHKKKLMNRDYK